GSHVSARLQSYGFIKRRLWVSEWGGRRLARRRVRRLPWALGETPPAGPGARTPRACPHATAPPGAGGKSRCLVSPAPATPAHARTSRLGRPPRTNRRPGRAHES